MFTMLQPEVGACKVYKSQHEIMATKAMVFEFKKTVVRFSVKLGL